MSFRNPHCIGFNYITETLKNKQNRLGATKNAPSLF